MAKRMPKKPPQIDAETRKILVKLQKYELTEYLVYAALAASAKGKNKKILENIAKDELHHYNMWHDITGEDCKPYRFRVFMYKLFGRVLGLTFAAKLLEKSEIEMGKRYEDIEKRFPQTKMILAQERKAEKDLIGLISEEKLEYIGSMVLGLNDALVELTGTLAGLTFALQDAKLVGIAGLITGVAASLSMGASEYLSQKAEIHGKNPFKASWYTGVTYFFAVILLVTPFLVLQTPFIALSMTLLAGIMLILVFTYFISITEEISFKKRFFEMAAISLSVMFISFLIGLFLRTVLMIEI